MKICNDMLKALKIETIYILANEVIYLCYPLEIKEMNWLVTTDADNLSGNIKLRVKFRGSFLYLKGDILRKDVKNLYSFTYEINITEDKPYTDNFKFYFFKSLQEMEEKDILWNKRKELRYEIGLDEKKIQLIKFKSPEQILINDKLQLPCIVNNLSYNGAKITTLEGNFQKDKKVLLALSFINPIEQIHIISNIKNCLIKSTKEKKIISILSLKFENASLEYKERLGKYIEIVEENNA